MKSDGFSSARHLPVAPNHDVAGRTRSGATTSVVSNGLAERSVLGACFLVEKGIATARRVLEPEDFLTSAHQAIFRAMLSLDDYVVRVDTVTVASELERAGKLVEAGGLVTLAELAGAVPTSANLLHYCRIVKERAWRNSVATTARALAAAAMDDATSSSTLNSGLAKFLSDHSITSMGWSERILPFQTAAELEAESPEPAHWIVPGVLAQGAISELSGKLKTSGKTTFALRMVAAILTGGEFLDRPTERGPVVFLTEERRPSYQAALRRAGVAEAGDLVILRWDQVSATSWPAIVDSAARECKRRGATVLLIDTLSKWAGIPADGENDAGLASTAMKPLQLAAAQGLAVMVLRHERKVGGDLGEAARGSSVFSGEADILVSIRRPEGGYGPNVRELRAIGRFDDICESLMIELAAHGYVVLGSASAAAREHAEKCLLSAMPPQLEAALTEQEILARVPEGLSRSTARRALGNLLNAGRVKRAGAGRKGDPFRFWQSGFVSDPL